MAVEAKMNHKYVILFSIFLNLFFVKFSIANDDNSANESIGCETELLNIITPGLIDQTNKIQALQKALQETTDQAQKDQIQKQLAEAENRAMVATLLIPFSNEQLVKFYSSQPNLFAGIAFFDNILCLGY